MIKEDFATLVIMTKTGKSLTAHHWGGGSRDKWINYGLSAQWKVVQL